MPTPWVFRRQKRSDEVSSVSVSICESHIKVVAKKYILAAGGIENPRLLLNSANAFHPTGIGNQHDNVGRFYMSHLMGTLGAVDPSNRKEILFPFEMDKQGVYCRRRWWLTSKIQRQEKVGNGIMYFNRPMNVKK